MDILVGDDTPKPNKPDERDLCREFDETPKPEMKEEKKTVLLEEGLGLQDLFEVKDDPS